MSQLLQLHQRIKELEGQVEYYRQAFLTNGYRLEDLEVRKKAKAEAIAESIRTGTELRKGFFPNTREGNNEQRSWRRKFNNRDKEINPVGRPKGSGVSKTSGPREFACKGCGKVVPTHQELKEHQEELECTT